MKTCKTCAYSKPDWTMWIVNQHWKYSKCRHPHQYYIDKVTGNMVYVPRSCSVERNDYYGDCGPLGKDWESRK